MILEKVRLEKEGKCTLDGLTIDITNQVTMMTPYKKVYGLGERYHAINLKGKSVCNIVEEAFCNQGEKTYFPLPFFILDNGYGFFIDTKEVLSFDFTQKDYINFESLGDMYVFKGTYKEIIKDFIHLTGQTKKAPKWVFGPWISAHRWHSQAMVNEVREKLKDLHIPITVMVLEQWSDEATFYIFNGAKYPNKRHLTYEDFDFSQSPWYDPKKMIDQLHGDGIKLLLWQCPVVKHIPKEEAYNHRHEQEWQLAKKNQWVVQSGDQPYIIPEGNWFNGSMIPDFTNKDTLKWWFENRRYLMDIGVDGFKTDGGEFIHGEAFNSIGESELQLKNNYSLEYVKAYSDFLGKDKVTFSRAGYTGQQAYSLQWAGDQKSTFEELQAVYKAGITSSLSGQINWGFDIAGFSGELPSIELYYRSNQLAVFTPIMQVHSEPVGGQFSAIDPIRSFNNERNIWNIANDKTLLDDIRNLYNLRMNLIPYTYSEYLKALRDKTTLMKHMSIDYLGDFPENQYLYGDLIVAAVLDEEETLDIKLPDGSYYDIFTDERFEGSLHIEKCLLTDMYVFIKEGSALVTKEPCLLPKRMSNDLVYNVLNFKLYGNKGKYHFLDDENDFIIIWDQGHVYTEGKVTLEIKWMIV